MALIHESDEGLRERGLDPARVRRALQRQDTVEAACESAAEYRDMAPAERLEEFINICRSLPAFLAMQADGGGETLNQRDPLPESSVRHLQRLRADYRARGS